MFILVFMMGLRAIGSLRISYFPHLHLKIYDIKI